MKIDFCDRDDNNSLLLLLLLLALLDDVELKNGDFPDNRFSKLSNFGRDERFGCCREDDEVDTVRKLPMAAF